MKKVPRLSGDFSYLDNDMVIFHNDSPLFFCEKIALKKFLEFAIINSAKAILKMEDSTEMKRVQAACIMQTLRFQQKEDGSPVEFLLRKSREEVERYKTQLNKNKIRYKIDAEVEQPDGSIIVRIRKEYNSNANVDEYFN